MAMTTDNLKQIAVTRYMEGLRQVPGDYAQLFEQRSDDEASLRVASMTGVGAVPQWTGGDMPTAAIDQSGATTVTYTKYALDVIIDKYDAKDIPEIIANASAKLGIAVAQTRALTCVAKFTNGFTDTTAIDSVALFATTHATATTTRSNRTSSALDRTSFMSAVKSYRKWVSYQDIPMDLTPFGFYLVVPPDLEETAVQIVGSPYSSNQMQTNVASTYNTTVVVWPHLTSTTDWFLMSKAEKPLGYWQRTAPEFRVDIKPSDRTTHISVDMAQAAYNKPTPDGGYGSH